MHRFCSPLTTFAARHILGRTGSGPSQCQQTSWPGQCRTQLRTVEASPGDQPGAQP